jgi:hypothetical protein
MYVLGGGMYTNNREVDLLGLGMDWFGFQQVALGFLQAVFRKNKGHDNELQVKGAKKVT